MSTTPEARTRFAAEDEYRGFIPGEPGESVEGLSYEEVEEVLDYVSETSSLAVLEDETGVQGYLVEDHETGEVYLLDVEVSRDEGGFSLDYQEIESAEDVREALDGENPGAFEGAAERAPGTHPMTEAEESGQEILEPGPEGAHDWNYGRNSEKFE